MNQVFLQVLSQFKDKRVLVWGDFILDEYILTTTSRISREAPVIVTEFESSDYRAGGAGNVVMNIKSMGAVPVPFGIIGQDNDGWMIKEIFSSHSIKTDYLCEVADYRTPKKSRILSGGDHTKKQQVLRIDTLNKKGISHYDLDLIKKQLTYIYPQVDAVIVSDYLHESVQVPLLGQMISMFPQIKVIVDSRRNLLDFQHITLATPNEPEIKKIFPANKFLNQDDFFTAGAELMTLLNSQGVILKRGQQGIIVFEKDKKPVVIGIHGSTEIVDVTGAGDTVIAVVALGLCTNTNFVTAASLANIAAGIVVMKEGAYPVSIDEINDEIHQ